MAKIKSYAASSSKFLLSLVGLFILVIGVLAGVILSQSSADTRSQALEPYSCPSGTVATFNGWSVCRQYCPSPNRLKTDANGETYECGTLQSGSKQHMCEMAFCCPPGTTVNPSGQTYEYTQWVQATEVRNNVWRWRYGEPCASTNNPVI